MNYLYPFVQEVPFNRRLAHYCHKRHVEEECCWEDSGGLRGCLGMLFCEMTQGAHLRSRALYLLHNPKRGMCMTQPHQRRKNMKRWSEFGIGQGESKKAVASPRQNSPMKHFVMMLKMLDFSLPDNSAYKNRSNLWQDTVWMACQIVAISNLVWVIVTQLHKQCFFHFETAVWTLVQSKWPKSTRV